MSMFGRFLKNIAGGRSDRRARLDGLQAEVSRLMAAGEDDAALAAAAAALAIAPDDVRALRCYGMLLVGKGQPQTAVTYFRQALERDRRNADIRIEYGNALAMTGDIENAEVEYRQAIRLAPDSGRGYQALGSLLLKAERPAEAVPLFRRALEFDLDDVTALRGLAFAANRVCDYALASDLYLRLHDKGVLGLEERYLLGIALQHSGRLDAAGNMLETTLALTAANSQIGQSLCQSLAFNHLLSGDWATGFLLNEQRHGKSRAYPETAEEKAWIDYFDAALAATPAWTAGGCAGKRVLVWSDQGLGDAIMALRFLPVLRAEWQAAAVTVLCPPALKALEAACPGVRFIAAEPVWKARPGEFDAHCALMSLPHLMGVTPSAIPGSVPYLHVPESAQSRWREQCAQLRPGMRVGLAWTGNPRMKLDKLRSMALNQLRPLLSVDGVSFVSLQKDEAAREELRLSGLPVIDWMDRCCDLMDTAALIDNLDLVVSVDTAVAHLAGALGKPVWLLNRFESEWRWMRGRQDSPWYPSMRIFNQTESRNWGPVVGMMARELQDLATRRQASHAH